MVAGHSNQLDTYEKRKAFELFRQSLNNPEIILFDELLARAKYIVGKSNEISEQKENSGDLPF